MVDYGALHEWLVELVARELHVDRAEIDAASPLADMGLNSASVLTLSAEIQARLNRPIDPDIIYDHPTIDALCRRLTADAEQVVRPSAVSSPHEPIAIVGIGCRFPGSQPGSKEFFKLLLAGAAMR